MVLKATVQKQSSYQSLSKVSSEAFFEKDFLKIPNTKTPLLVSLSENLQALRQATLLKADFKTGVFL